MDRTWFELPDLEAAREEARRHAFLLLAEGYRRHEDRRDWTIEIRDADGRLVHNLTLEEAIS